MPEEEKILESERGGISAIKGFKYQKNIVALFSVRMYCNIDKISRIICEYRNDIEILHEEYGLSSWQIKTAGSAKLSKKEIIDSLNLFKALNKKKEYSRFVLLCDNQFIHTSLEPLTY